MTQEDRERLIEDMATCGHAWEEDTSRPDFSLPVVQRLATLTPEEYEAVWAEFQAREAEDMEAGMEVLDVEDASDLWGAALTPATVNAQTFGFAIPPGATVDGITLMPGEEIEFPPEMVWRHNSSTPTEDLQRAREFVESQIHATSRLQPMTFPTSVRPYVTLTPETEAILGRLLNPTTTFERLCVAALRGDAVALAALEDGIKQGELTL